MPQRYLIIKILPSRFISKHSGESLECKEWERLTEQFKDTGAQEPETDVCCGLLGGRELVEKGKVEWGQKVEDAVT